MGFRNPVTSVAASATVNSGDQHPIQFDKVGGVDPGWPDAVVALADHGTLAGRSTLNGDRLELVGRDLVSPGYDAIPGSAVFLRQSDPNNVDGPGAELRSTSDVVLTPFAGDTYRTAGTVRVPSLVVGGHPTTGLPIPVASKAERDALTKTVGLTVLRTDLGGLPQRWDGSGWRYRTSGTASGTTDASGYYFWPHNGDGQTPLMWACGPLKQITDALSQVFKPLAWFADTANAQLRAVRTDSSTFLAGNPVAVWWIADF